MPASPEGSGSASNSPSSFTRPWILLGARSSFEGCTRLMGQAVVCRRTSNLAPQELTPLTDPAILWLGFVHLCMRRGTIKSKSPRRLEGRRCGDMTSSSLRGKDDLHSLRSLPRASSGHSSNGLLDPDAHSEEAVPLAVAGGDLMPAAATRRGRTAALLPRFMNACRTAAVAVPACYSSVQPAISRHR